jgi:hypothetical protein
VQSGVFFGVWRQRPGVSATLQRVVPLTAVPPSLFVSNCLSVVPGNGIFTLLPEKSAPLSLTARRVNRLDFGV